MGQDMKLKSTKSKCLSIEKGKVIHNKFLSITTNNKTENIPSILKNPVKFLGRTIIFEIKDKDQAETLKLAVTKGLSLIDKSFHRGVHKLWILHHLLIPRLHWPLLIYEITISFVLSLERKISAMIRKWLRLHSSTTSICLYSSCSPCPLPLKSLSSVMKSSKVVIYYFGNQRISLYLMDKLI